MLKQEIQMNGGGLFKDHLLKCLLAIYFFLSRECQRLGISPVTGVVKSIKEREVQ